MMTSVSTFASTSLTMSATPGEYRNAGTVWAVFASDCAPAAPGGTALIAIDARGAHTIIAPTAAHVLMRGPFTAMCCLVALITTARIGSYLYYPPSGRCVKRRHGGLNAQFVKGRETSPTRVSKAEAREPEQTRGLPGQFAMGLHDGWKAGSPARVATRSTRTCPRGAVPGGSPAVTLGASRDPASRRYPGCRVVPGVDAEFVRFYSSLEWRQRWYDHVLIAPYCRPKR